MKSLEVEHEKLKRILTQAYQEKEKIEVGDLWPEGIMRRIREFGAIQPTPGFLEMFEPFVWRLAPVVSLLILGLIVVLLALDFTSGYDVFQLLMNGKEELTLAQMLGA